MLSPALTFLVEYLNLPDAVGDPDAQWETFQLKHLNNPSLFAIELKSRQVGWSWLSAAESIALSCIYPKTTSIFVSINQEEAAEKIRYAKAVLEALDDDVRPGLLIDNRLGIELSNGSRLISHPCRPPRGKAKAIVYLDEFAHYPNADAVYRAAVPITTKGGRLRIGSSPLGARGKFWEIYTETMQKYPGYTRNTIPWWEIGSLCNDVDTAEQEAGPMPTEDRVRKFGTARLIQLFENLTLEDFQQEYECAWLDETVSWIDWDLIQRNQALAVSEKHWYRKVKGVDAGLLAINEVFENVRDGHIEQALVGGVDIGRTRDTTEIILLGLSQFTNALPYRLHISLERVEFEAQEAVIKKALDVLPITELLIDRNGIGAQLAENISKRNPQAQGVNFTNETKQLWAIEAKLRAQRTEVPIPLERDFMYQIHSIRRKATAAGNKMQFDVDSNEKHHADMFWAWALAIWAGKQDGFNSISEGSNPLGDDFRG